MDHQFVLTMTDYFSKYVEAVPIKDKSAVSVARGIYEVYCRQGVPVHIITDQGTGFANQVATCSYNNYSKATYMYVKLYGVYFTGPFTPIFFIPHFIIRFISSFETYLKTKLKAINPTAHSVNINGVNSH